MSKRFSRAARSQRPSRSRSQPRLPPHCRGPRLLIPSSLRSSCIRCCSPGHPGDDEDPGFHAAVREEEAAIQALGIMTPTTAAGAAAQLVYMAEIEGSYADDNSPIRRTMLTVAKALAGGLPA